MCMEANGFNAKPNYLVIDWVEVDSEAHEVADYLNFENSVREALNAVSLKQQAINHTPK